jgi:hypothetical protein
MTDFNGNVRALHSQVIIENQSDSSRAKRMLRSQRHVEGLPNSRS